VSVSFLKLGLNNNFFFKCSGSVYDQEAAFLLYYLGPPQEAKKFSFEFDFQSMRVKKRSSFQGSCACQTNKDGVIVIHFTLNSVKLKTIGKFQLVWKVRVFENDFTINKNVTGVKIVEVP